MVPCWETLVTSPYILMFPSTRPRTVQPQLHTSQSHTHPAPRAPGPARIRPRTQAQDAGPSGSAKEGKVEEHTSRTSPPTGQGQGSHASPQMSVLGHKQPPSTSRGHVNALSSGNTQSNGGGRLFNGFARPRPTRDTLSWLHGPEGKLPWTTPSPSESWRTEPRLGPAQEMPSWGNWNHPVTH